MASRLEIVAPSISKEAMRGLEQTAKEFKISYSVTNTKGKAADASPKRAGSVDVLDGNVESIREELAYKKRIYYANRGVMLKNLSKMEFDVDIETNMMTDSVTLNSIDDRRSRHDPASVRGSVEKLMEATRQGVPTRSSKREASLEMSQMKPKRAHGKDSIGGASIAEGSVHSCEAQKITEAGMAMSQSAKKKKAESALRRRGNNSKISQQMRLQREHAKVE